MSIKTFIKPALKFVQKHATKFLAGGAILSEIFGFYLMHKEAPIVKEKLDKLPPNSTLLDKVKVAGPIYLPAFLMLLGSSGCIIGGCALGDSRLAKMTNYAMMTEATLAQYQHKVVEKLGVDEANKIQDDIAKDLMQERPMKVKDVIETGDGPYLFYDPLSGRYFRSCANAIEMANLKFKNMVLKSGDGFGSVNDLYECMNLPRIDLGGDHGWSFQTLETISEVVTPGSYDDAEYINTEDGCRPIVYYIFPSLYNKY